jgi:glycosyltransferase involved in cell wall biosynthesis
MSRIVIGGVQTLYVRGGAEVLVGSLAQALRQRDHQVDVVTLPYVDQPRTQILQTFLAWRMLNLRRIHGRSVDLVIPTKWPSYAVSHPNKRVWLVHQHRQAYDLYGTPYSDMHARPDGWLFVRLVRRLDAWALGEAQARFSISRNVADRLARFNHLQATPLYPPPPLADRLRPGAYGDYLLAPGRFEPIKRVDLLVQAMAMTKGPVKLLLAGDGLERANLERLAARLDLGDRVRFLGRVSDDELLDLYADCLGVVYPPFDEDYGYVTVEAFLARKPVISVADAGGVLEFLRDGVNGYVAQPNARSLADAIDRLWGERHRASEFGANGYEAVKAITWDRVAAALTGDD